MSDQGRRRPRTPAQRKAAAERRVAARRAAAAEKVVAEEAKPAPKTVPAWRQRLYRIPVIGTVAYVVWPPRTAKPGAIRRSLSSALAVIALLGIGMAAYPWAGESYPFFYRVPVEKLIEWSNFLSDMQTNRLQDQLEKDLLACGDRYCRGEGDPLTRIEIPSIGVNTIVVEGTTPSALKAGAGHYRNSPLPGQKGNVAIAGHRTTYGRPFNKIDALKPRERIVLTSPVGRFTYEIMKAPRGTDSSNYAAAWITHPFDWSVVGKTEGDYLTLTSCHPKGSARQRIIVRAKLVGSEPVSELTAA